jgi:GDSL-like Lipase/Acylhydrolase family
MLVSLAMVGVAPPERAVAATTGSWHLDGMVVDGPDGVVTHTEGSIARTVTSPVDATFSGTYDPNVFPTDVAPGQRITVDVAVTAALGSTDRRGSAALSVIEILDGRWTGDAVEASVGCQPDPAPLGPLTCTGSPAYDRSTKTATGRGRFVFAAPRSGTTFTPAIAVLNARAGIGWQYHFRTGPAPAGSTTTTSSAASPSGVGLEVTYTRPERFVADANGVLQSFTTPSAVHPSTGYAVDFTLRRQDGKRCQRADAFAWVANGRALGAASLDPSASGACRARVLVPEGIHHITIRMRAADGATATVTTSVVVQDWLVVGLGDSNGAGEGDPDALALLPGSTDTWSDSRCHRSSRSFEAQTARALEEHDGDTSVTFVHLACSGASIDEGMIGKYAGIEAETPLLDPQLSDMVRLADGREIDAALVSIGINDIGFGPLVAFCLSHDDCPHATGFTKDPNETLDAFVTKILDPNPKAKHLTLGKLYDRLAHRLKIAGVKARRVFITQYFDSTRDENGVFCNPLIGVTNPLRAITAADDLGLFDLDETAWAYKKVLVPLNKAVRAAAQKHGWRIVTGIQRGFGTHGYCSSDSWIRSLTGSLSRQASIAGTLHATRDGNTFSASKVEEALLASLYRSHEFRLPRRSNPS